MVNTVTYAIQGTTWQRFIKPSVDQGKTAYPRKPSDQERLGICWDYDGETTLDGTDYHKYQVQPNTRKIPSTIKKWKDANGGTHTVMATVFVKKDGTKEDVEEGLSAAIDQIQGV